MRAMLRAARPYFIALACCWIGLLLAAFVLAREHSYSHWIMAAALPAFAVEAVFYLACGFDAQRGWFRNFVHPKLEPGLLWASAIAPYLIFSSIAGTFAARPFYLLGGLCAVMALWYFVLPHRFAYDLGFLVIAAAVVISGVFRRVYISPDPHLRIDVLGHIMWTRLAITAFLSVRGWNPGAFSFWPSAREWRIGFVCYLIAIGPLIFLSKSMHDSHFEVPHETGWRIAAVGIGTFFASLWFIAFGEELFFRGVVARALLNLELSPIWAVAGSSALFGLAHLWFHTFPNFHKAAVAAVLGVACGIAYLQTRSVRTSMVTHAFVVMTWRVCFRDY